MDEIPNEEYERLRKRLGEREMWENIFKGSGMFSKELTPANEEIYKLTIFTNDGEQIALEYEEKDERNISLNGDKIHEIMIAQMKRKISREGFWEWLLEGTKVGTLVKGSKIDYFDVS